MKIAIIGGTGSLGTGLGLRLAAHHEILIGSRDAKKGRGAAEKLSDLTRKEILGGTVGEVSELCDSAIIATPYDPNGSLLLSLREALAEKLVISATVPMTVKDGLFVYSLDSGSAAEHTAAILSKSRVAAAIHTVPAPLLVRDDLPLNFDILVAADGRQTFIEAASLIRDIDGVRPLYAGPLSQARLLEGLVPLLLNAAKLNGLRNLSIRIV